MSRYVRTNVKVIFQMNVFSPNSLLWGSLLEKERLAAICSGRIPGACPPCVRLVSALITLWPHLQTLSAMCLPCVPASTVWLPCVRHVPALWQGCGIISQNFFCPLRSPQRWYCMPVGQFPWHSFWLPKLGLCKRALCLKNCLGSMLV